MSTSKNVYDEGLEFEIFKNNVSDIVMDKQVNQLG
jgi:hypothetical protein